MLITFSSNWDATHTFLMKQISENKLETASIIPITLRNIYSVAGNLFDRITYFSSGCISAGFNSSFEMKFCLSNYFDNLNQPIKKDTGIITNLH